ncbi:hypothetical protein ACIBEJ_02530 [Nonomuraea sp. NPDC050790]|uniref:hypothetical protein n=1 Tax=Nonomuraea sp. NPDC050790 TaxID=3364371 RepID=UPI0037B5DE71
MGSAFNGVRAKKLDVLLHFLGLATGERLGEDLMNVLHELDDAVDAPVRREIEDWHESFSGSFDLPLLDSEGSHARASAA